MRTRTRITLAGLALGAALAGGVAWATIPSAEGTIHGCYRTGKAGVDDPNKGQLRVVDGASDCTSREAAISWNEKGVPGVAGATGPAGPAGAQGAAGAAGDTGAAGPTGPQGVKGDAGPAGPNGTNGADGAKGDKGDQGERGDIGATGPAGAQGPQGPAGSDPATSTFLGRLGADTNNAAHGDGECVIGQIALTAASISPWGVPASGQLLPINQHQVLFQLLGTAYGGDGVSFFVLPDLRGLAPNGMTYSICIEGFIPTAS